ncbi:helix-turn-helix transcriptional regulator [Bengtsoniella intestinalis]|uniref:helix-turn-helix domain-containing protein n=1 Tax=Bengtsoniella intestinalis TaxID=3073143 RepID=UPI00391F83DC
MEVHERLKALREDRDLTQKDIAQLLGTTRQQIYKYESGQQVMNIFKLKQLCIFYGVSADYILGLPKNGHWPR